MRASPRFAVVVVAVVAAAAVPAAETTERWTVEEVVLSDPRMRAVRVCFNPKTTGYERRCQLVEWRSPNVLRAMLIAAAVSVASVVAAEPDERAKPPGR